MTDTLPVVTGTPTHTHIHTYTHTHIHTYTHTHNLTHILSLATMMTATESPCLLISTPKSTHTLSLTHSLSLSHTHTYHLSTVMTATESPRWLISTPKYTRRWLGSTKCSALTVCLYHIYVCVYGVSVRQMCIFILISIPKSARRLLGLTKCSARRCFCVTYILCDICI